MNDTVNDRRDTEPGGLKPQRDTQPPGANTIDDPEHAAIVAVMEKSLDRRFNDMTNHLLEERQKDRAGIEKLIAKLVEAVQSLANEKTEVHELKRLVGILQLDIEAFKARCPQCSIPPQGAASMPPGG